jgi:hypothetical protein
MYSKFGKILTYRYHILLSKDKILSSTNRRKDVGGVKRTKKFKMNSLPVTEKPEPQIKSFAEEPQSPPDALKKVPSKEMSMFRSQSREDFYKVHSEKSAAPPVGYYNCNYSYIRKSQKSVVFRKRVKTSSRVTQNEPLHTLSNYSPSSKVMSISFKKQTHRKDIFVKDLNDKRFENFNKMPQVCSNFKRIHTPDISRMKSRDDLMKKPEYCNSYNPEYRLVKQDLGKVYNFTKYPDRKPLFVEKTDLKDYEINWDSVEKKKYSVNFSKSYERFKEPSL